MSTILNTDGRQLQVARPLNADFRAAVIVADWNADITGALRDGALKAFRMGGVDTDKNVDVIQVPGTVELVYAAALNMKHYDAIIVIGCVIRGDTPHFDYVCQIASQGVATLNARGETPVIFGVLTVENLMQAQERAGGSLGNKGAEAAAAAIAMANLSAMRQ